MPHFRWTTGPSTSTSPQVRPLTDRFNLWLKTSRRYMDNTQNWTATACELFVKSLCLPSDRVVYFQPSRVWHKQWAGGLSFPFFNVFNWVTLTKNNVNWQMTVLICGFLWKPLSVVPGTPHAIYNLFNLVLLVYLICMGFFPLLFFY